MVNFNESEQFIKDFKLSDSQRRPVEDNESQYMRILAGAGAGKTEVIAQKIIKLLNDNLATPDQIVAFTYTDNAAASLKNRIYKLILKDGKDIKNLEDMYIGTIHAYCKDLLDKKGDYDQWEILDENKEFAFILAAAKHDLNLRNNEIYTFQRTSSFQWTTSIVINENIKEDELKEKAPEFYEKFERYLSILKEHKRFTFDSLMKTTLEKLNEKEFKINIRYLFVDEFQDINKIQYELIKKISDKSKCKIVIVGDPRQTIYEWRGSDPELFNKFENDFKSKNYFIDENWRSRSVIVENANKIAKQLGNYDNMKYKEQIKGGTLILNTKDKLEEADSILKIIQELKEKNGLKYSDIAILSRSIKPKYIGEILDNLKKNKIPYLVRGSSGLFQREEVKCMENIFNWLVFKLNLKMKKVDEKEFHDKLDKLEKLEKNLDGSLNDWSKLITRIDVNQAKADLQKLVDKLSNGKAGINNITDLFQNILNILNFNDIKPYADNNKLIISNLGKFNVLLTDYETQQWVYSGKNKLNTIINGLNYYIEWYAKANYESGVDLENENDINALNIMTVHQAKGLEWPVVIISSMLEGVFPSKNIGKPIKYCCDIPADLFNKEKYSGNINSELRLFYVASTRPSDLLIISCYDNKKYKKSSFLDYITPNISKEDEILDLNIKSKSKEQDYFKETSVSEIINYMRCHYLYLLRNKFGYQPGINEAIGYGNALHFILKKLTQFKKEHPGIPDNTIMVEDINNNFYLPFAKDKTFYNLLKSAKEYLDKFYRSNKEIINKAKYEEYKLVLPIKFNDRKMRLLIDGRIDMVENDNDMYSVIDYKTSKNVESLEDSEFQIRLYSKALQLKLDNKIRLLNGKILYIQENEAKEVEINDDLLDNTVDKVTNIFNEMEDKNYSPNLDYCTHCDLRRVCYHYINKILE